MNWYKTSARPEMSYAEALLALGFSATEVPNALQIKQRYRDFAKRSNHLDRHNPQSSIDFDKITKAREILLSGPKSDMDFSSHFHENNSQDNIPEDVPAWQTDFRSSYNKVGKNFRDLNFCLMSIYSESMKYGDVSPYVFIAFDGYYFRGQFTAKSNERALGYGGMVMEQWNSHGANPYETQAVIVSRRESSQWKVVRLNGQDASGKNIIIESNGMPYNDKTFVQKLQNIIKGVDKVAQSHWNFDRSGKFFWGKRAAGLLFVRNHPKYGKQLLLCKRSAWTQQGGTWGTTGGALEPNEDPYQGAVRETIEEIGNIPPHKVINSFVWKANGGDFTYTTFICLIEDMKWKGKSGYEISQTFWVNLEQSQQMPLHTGFAEMIASLNENLFSDNVNKGKDSVIEENKEETENRDDLL